MARATLYRLPRMCAAKFVRAVGRVAAAEIIEKYATRMKRESNAEYAVDDFS